MSRFLACLILAVSAGTAQACLCHDDPPVETLRFRSSDVFVGRVMSVVASGIGYRGQVFIERSWKGAKAGAIVVVATIGTSTACGVQFRPGDRLLMFARYGGSDQKNVYWAWRCDGTTANPTSVTALSDSLGTPLSVAEKPSK